MAYTAATAYRDGRASETETFKNVRQVRKRLTKVFPESSRFYAILDKFMKVSDGNSNKLEFQSQSDFPRSVTMDASYSSSVTTLGGVSVNHIVPSDVLQVPDTQEQLVVLTVNYSTGSFTVGTRGTMGGGTPRALVSGERLYLLGTAVEEGADAIASRGIKSANNFNWVQQHEYAFGYTDRMRALLTYDDMGVEDREEENAIVEFKRQTVRKYLFQSRAELAPGDGSNAAVTHNRWLLGGALDYIKEYGDNIVSANGAFTYDELNSAMSAKVTRFAGSAQRNWIAIGSTKVCRIMSEWQLPQGRVQFGVKDRELGIAFDKFFGLNWSMSVVQDEAFEEIEEYGEWLMILHPSYFKEVIMAKLPFTINRGITGPPKDGSHTIKDQITFGSTVEFTGPEKHLLIKEITS